MPPSLVLAQVRERAVDLMEVGVIRYHLVELQASAEVSVDEARHIVVKRIGADKGSLSLARAQEIRSVDLDIGADKDHTDRAGAMARVRDLKRLFCGLLQSDAAAAD